MPLHKPHPFTSLPNLEVHPPPPPHIPQSSPNFIATTLLQSCVSSTPKHHSHFPKRALLELVSFLVPKPWLAIGAHTWSHLTKCDLDSPPYQPKMHHKRTRPNIKSPILSNSPFQSINTLTKGHIRTKKIKERGNHLYLPIISLVQKSAQQLRGPTSPLPSAFHSYNTPP